MFSPASSTLEVVPPPLVFHSMTVTGLQGNQTTHWTPHTGMVICDWRQLVREAVGGRGDGWSETDQDRDIYLNL